MLVILLLLSLSSEPSLPAGITCEQVKSLVAEHGQAASLAWAVQHGYSWKQIREAKRCLR